MTDRNVDERISRADCVIYAYDCPNCGAEVVEND